MKEGINSILTAGKPPLNGSINDYFDHNNKSLNFNISIRVGTTTNAIREIDSERYSGIFIPSLLLPHGREMDIPARGASRSAGLYLVKYARDKGLYVLVNDIEEGRFALDAAEKFGAQCFIRNGAAGDNVCTKNFEYFQEIYRNSQA